MTMRLLRDLKESTKVLILLELTTGHHTRLKTLAEKLEITVQGASEYLRDMAREGLVHQIRGQYRATNKGVEVLHSSFLEMRDFVDESTRKLSIVNVCTAIAGCRIEKGERVGLFMEDGLLTAYPGRRSSSTGTAVLSAGKGDALAIRDLEGIVGLRPGTIWIAGIPDVKERNREVSLAKMKKLYGRMRPDKTAAMDVAAIAALKRLGLRCDFEFAAISAAIEAAQKGLNVLLFCSKEDVNRVISAIDGENALTSAKIRYESRLF